MTYQSVKRSGLLSSQVALLPSPAQDIPHVDARCSIPASHPFDVPHLSVKRSGLLSSQVALLPSPAHAGLPDKDSLKEVSERLWGTFWLLISSIIFAVFTVVLRYFTLKDMADNQQQAREEADNPQSDVAPEDPEVHNRGGNGAILTERWRGRGGGRGSTHLLHTTGGDIHRT